MPATVIVGGQYGSEGKGKVAHLLAIDAGAVAAIRVGGTNSGHTVVDCTGRRLIFRQLPTAAILPDVVCVIGAGSYVDLNVLLDEIARVKLPASRILIDPNAMLISEGDKKQERASGLMQRIGSTGSGTGAAVSRRVGRGSNVRLAGDEPALARYVGPVSTALRELLDQGKRVLVEGTQGFGLSLLHGQYPYVTSRDTTAATFVAEAGLSPLDVDDIVLVLRAFPIRVPGSSGRLVREIDWPIVTAESGSETPLVEYTSVTGGVRRVGRFDAEVARAAIGVNQPTRIVLNHLDYVDHSATGGEPSERVISFADEVARAIGRRIDYYGLGAATLAPARVLKGHRLREIGA